MIAELFSFRGRTGRVGYWRAWLLINIMFAGVYVIGLLAAVTFRIGVFSALGLAVMPLFLAAAAALSCRRLHDRGKSGWWLAVFYLLPFVLGAVAQGLAAAGGGMALVAAALVLAELGLVVWSWLELGFWRGPPGPNRYGPAPS